MTERAGKGKTKSQAGALASECELTKGNEPLRDCVQSAVEQYFAALDGHATSDLYHMVIAEVEMPLLKIVMKHTRGNHTRAADLLGINRGTLRKKLKHYKLE